MASPKPRVCASLISDSGAIDNWVAAATSNTRYVFLSYISNPNLRPGQTANVDLYVLTRAFQKHPLADYEYTRKSTRAAIGKLRPVSTSKSAFNVLQRVPLETLWAIPGVVGQIESLFEDPNGPCPGANRTGNGSVFQGAYRCGQATLEAGTELGLREVMTTIFCNGRQDLVMHSKFRVEG